ncbi:MAG: Gfo/Idh/MocA family oxidoreductase [Rhodospirillaceae bacterium]|nr:Gfo/Idh/MocA family oxidoreductase [Rhodospirillaceae bacterium]
MTVMRAIVTGTGSIATRHLRNLRQLFPAAILVVVSRPQGKGISAEIQSLVSEQYTDLAAALKVPVDLAVIATPAPFHVEQAMTLVGQGIPTLIEKPLAVTVAECDQLLALCRRNDVPLLVGYCLRYHPLVAILQERLAAGAIGRLYNMRAEVGQYLPNWRPGTDYRSGVTAQRALGGGALLELSHEIDLVRSLLGMPHAVTAVAARISELEIDVEDIAEIILRHRVAGQEALASIHLDLFRRVPRRRITVDGDGGSAELDFGRATLTFNPVAGAPVVHGVPDGFAINDIYLAELQDLIACSKFGRQPLASLAEGLATLRIVEASAQAAHSGKTISLSGEVSGDCP